jgi:non-ribosomal peptide synthetase component F
VVERGGGGGGGGGGMYQVWFQFEAAGREVLELGGLKWSGYKVERDEARFELSVVLEEAGEVIVGEMEYDEELYSAKTISQMLEDYKALLERMIDKPESRVSTVALSSQQERAELSLGFSMNLEAT